MTVIRTGAVHMGMPSWVQEIVTGVIIFVAVAVDRARRLARARLSSWYTLPALNLKEPSMRLKDKIALVTGASRGIGRASCLALATRRRDDRRHRADAQGPRGAREGASPRSAARRRRSRATSRSPPRSPRA